MLRTCQYFRKSFCERRKEDFDFSCSECSSVFIIFWIFLRWTERATFSLCVLMIWECRFSETLATNHIFSRWNLATNLQRSILISHKRMLRLIYQFETCILIDSQKHLHFVWNYLRIISNSQFAYLFIWHSVLLRCVRDHLSNLNEETQTVEN